MVKFRKVCATLSLVQNKNMGSLHGHGTEQVASVRDKACGYADNVTRHTDTQFKEREF